MLPAPAASRHPQPAGPFALGRPSSLTDLARCPAADRDRGAQGGSDEGATPGRPPPTSGQNANSPTPRRSTTDSGRRRCRLTTTCRRPRRWPSPLSTATPVAWTRWPTAHTNAIGSPEPQTETGDLKLGVPTATSRLPTVDQVFITDERSTSIVGHRSDQLPRIEDAPTRHYPRRSRTSRCKARRSSACVRGPGRWLLDRLDAGSGHTSDACVLLVAVLLAGPVVPSPGVHSSARRLLMSQVSRASGSGA
jgi:hypothetical protein